MHMNDLKMPLSLANCTTPKIRHSCSQEDLAIIGGMYAAPKWAFQVEDKMEESSMRSLKAMIASPTSWAHETPNLFT